MNNDFKDRLKEESKNDMPDLWDKIECRLEDKYEIQRISGTRQENKRNRNIIIVASFISLLVVSMVIKNFINSNVEMVENSTLQQESNEEKNESLAEDNSENTSESNQVDEFALDDNIGESELLEDLNLQKFLEDKIIVNIGDQNSYAADPNSIDYLGISENIVYGKVTSVKSYVKFGSMIYSDMTIEVIEDYKGDFKGGDTFIMGSHGGEMTYDEYISQIDPMRVEKFGYDKVEDKSKKFIDLRDGIPMYREGEYVLVYVSSLDNNEYYKEHPELRQKESYDYGVYKTLYVNPNTREVFKYEYKPNNTLEKIKVGTLDDIENIDLSIDLYWRR